MLHNKYTCKYISYIRLYKYNINIYIDISSKSITSSSSVLSPTRKKLGISLEKLWGCSNLKIIRKGELAFQRVFEECQDNNMGWDSTSKNVILPFKQHHLSTLRIYIME